MRCWSRDSKRQCDFNCRLRSYWRKLRKGLKKHGYTVYAISRGQGTIDYALENGIIDKGTIQEEPEIISQADYIVFGLYPHTMIDWIARNQQYFKSGAIITDVCGVKCNVVDVVQDFLRKDVEFIGSHPMAGKEVSGVQYSDDAIFTLQTLL